MQVKMWLAQILFYACDIDLQEPSKNAWNSFEASFACDRWSAEFATTQSSIAMQIILKFESKYSRVSLILQQKQYLSKPWGKLPRKFFAPFVLVRGFGSRFSRHEHDEAGHFQMAELLRILPPWTF